jgi:hypothetical protein
MPSPSETPAKQKKAAKSRVAVSVAAQLLAVSRSLAAAEVIILHTSEGVLRLTASAALWADLRQLIAPAVVLEHRRGRPPGRGQKLSPEFRYALEIEIARVKSGQATHTAAAALLGIRRQCFCNWFHNLPNPATAEPVKS